MHQPTISPEHLTVRSGHQGSTALSTETRDRLELGFYVAKALKAENESSLNRREAAILRRVAS